MNERYAPLFTPWKIRDVEMKNRFVLLPMEGTNMIEWQTKTCFNENIIEFYRERSKADVGLFIPGAIPIISVVGRKWAYTDKAAKIFEQAKPLIDEVHANGSKVFFQLTAGPGRAFPLPELFMKVYQNKPLYWLANKFVTLDFYNSAPDVSPNVWAPELMTREMLEEEIQQFVYAFGQTALRCKEIGVDGVEIHAVHEGYLLDQFTTKYTNHRTDKYGGSLENRLRFPCEIVKEIKRVCGEDYPVSLRYSVVSKVKGFNQGAVPGEEYVEVGRDLEESEKAIKIFEEAGYDMFSCDNGTYDSWYWPHPPVYAPLNTNLAEVEHIKKFTTKPVIAGGRMQADAAADSIKAGKIDAMGLGRQLLTDGQYVKKIEEDRMEDILPCISCHASCLPIGNTNGHGSDFDLMNIVMGRCALNPWTMNERKYKNTPAKEPKHIAVIGAGIGGMEVAIEASKRGHIVDLYEKTDRFGGVFNAAAVPEYKEKDRDLLKWFERELKKTSTNIHLNTEIKDINTLDADVIVVAIGAHARKLNVPGSDYAMSAEEYLYREKEVGENVVVIGGGLTGCEIAYELALMGKKPSVVEMTDVLVGAKGICGANSTMLRELLAYHKVPSYLNATCKEIRKDAVVISVGGKEQEIKADSVIVSVGYIPNKMNLPENNPKVKLIGDCDKVGNLKTVIKQAYDLVQEISY